MSTEIQAPFGLSPSGGIAAVTDPGTQVQQHLQSLVSTNPGERVMQPKYGIPLSSYVFGLSAQQVGSLVVADVQRAIQQWEPNVSVQNVWTTVSDTSEGNVAINVDYAPGAGLPSSAPVTTATVLVGGSVVGG